jgi:biofilm PGA synthesis N-glycosyltransferase PgaC
LRQTVESVLFLFIVLYPVVTAAWWIAGGLLFRLLDERGEAEEPPGGWPPVTLLIPAYNEAQVIGTCVRAAREIDYPHLEILVLDDGSRDGTAGLAADAAVGDPRIEVVRDAVNRGKAERLNLGFRRARHEVVAVTDADTHLHPLALKFLVARLSRSRRVAAVAGAAHVTNRRNVLCALQVLEAASIIGLIRRTQALGGRVGTVAGVLALFRREPVLEVGGFDSRMETEDIDLSWRLLMAGWHTSYEPAALIGMQVPSALRALWAQRKRWARGQGEVLHTHIRELMSWRHRGMWLLGLESLASLIWIIALTLFLVVAMLELLIGEVSTDIDFGIAWWGIAIAVVATLQLAFALGIDFRHDKLAAFAFLLGPLYPLGYWTISAAAALRSETPGLISGPRRSRVAWDIPREAAARVDEPFAPRGPGLRR